MGWLIGPTLASFIAAFIVVKLFDYIFAGVSGSLVNIARVGLFILTWAVVTAKGGMSSFSKTVRHLRQGNAVALETLTKERRN